MMLLHVARGMAFVNMGFRTAYVHMNCTDLLREESDSKQMFLSQKQSVHTEVSNHERPLLKCALIKRKSKQIAMQQSL